jgi:hypothetical protein
MRNTNNFVVDVLSKAVNLFIILNLLKNEKIILVSKLNHLRLKPIKKIINSTNKDAQQFSRRIETKRK